MQGKLMIRTVFISLALAGLVLAGIYAFAKLRTGEQVYHTDIFDLISGEKDLFFYFPRPEVLTGDFPVAIFPDTLSLPLVQSLLLPGTRKLPGAHNLILSWKDQNGLILYRTTPDQIEAWEKLQLESGFFPFPAQKEEYHSIPYSVRLTADDRFFCYTYYLGVFIGSYSQSMLQRTLAICSAETKATGHPSFIRAKESASKASYAGCLFREDSVWYAFDISRPKSQTWINGSLQAEAGKEKLFESFSPNKGKHDLRTEFIPATTTALIFFNNDSSLFQQEDGYNRILQSYCTGNISLVYHTSIDSTDQEFRTACLELTDRRRFLSEIKNLFPDTLLTTVHHAWHTDEEYIIYNTHQLMDNVNLLSCLSCFSREEDSYFAFYKNNLLVSDSREALLQYWKQIHIRQNMKGDEELLKLYLLNKSDDANVFIIAGREALNKQRLFWKEQIPRAFSNARLNGLFVQIIPEEGIRLYNGVIGTDTSK